jgi:protein gp37
MRDYLRARYADHAPPPNIWFGVSVEQAQAKSRIEHLRAAPAKVRFLSIEPLIGAIGAVNLAGIHWVIVGGESGPGSRPMAEDWVREILAQCEAQNVAFFFKQWGGIRPKAGGRTLDGREWNEMPVLAAA